ncbi:hypothetical protein ACH5RR_021323 [Cinchona calisaya]|uniref:Uncharacterized protein n=1 Tax=Cinchona calisaya TaxID=153742 RepID=A0ABD2ZI04_9GENT
MVSLCHNITGHIIGLDLSCSQLEGLIQPNTSIFHLSHLENLNLAYNDFLGSRISHEFGSLTSLSFHKLLQNLTRLRQLSLEMVKILSEETMKLTSSLTYLDLRLTELHDNLPNNVFHSLNMRALLLGEITTLQFLYSLDLGFCQISGTIPESIGNLTQLTKLDLGANSFKCQFPPSIPNLPYLENLYLSGNALSGKLGDFKSRSLKRIDLNNNQLNDSIPDSNFTLAQLIELDLGSNNFKSQFQSSLSNLSYLDTLDLARNQLTRKVVGCIPRSRHFDTFEIDSYKGNLALCGFPFSRECGDTDNSTPPPFPLLEYGQEYDTEFFDGFTWKAVLLEYGYGFLLGLAMGCLMFLTGKPRCFIQIVEESSKL